jgi:hypothetical protein
VPEEQLCSVEGMDRRLLAVHFADGPLHAGMASVSP